MALVVELLCSLILFSKHLLHSPIYEELQVFFSGQIHWYPMSLCKWKGILSLGCMSKGIRVLHPLNIICALVPLKILLNSLLSPGM